MDSGLSADTDFFSVLVETPKEGGERKGGSVASYDIELAADLSSP